jgi:type I site-specific restriction endonuclease
MADPEELARIEIDALLGPCGWTVQDKNAVNLSASRGVAVREPSFKTGEPDYTLFVDGKAIGTVEAKPAGHSLTGVEEQSEKYVRGVPFGLPAWRSPLPFSYESTGTETRFLNRLDPVPEPQRLRLSPPRDFTPLGGRLRAAAGGRNSSRVCWPQRQLVKPHPEHAALDRRHLAAQGAGD